MLSDGTHDAFVFDAEEAADGSLVLEVTIIDGEHKGDVVSLTASPGHDLGDPIDLMGLPGTIDVVDGRPEINILREPTLREPRSCS